MKTQDMHEKKQAWQPNRQEIADWLNTIPLGTLSTLGPEGQPQSATVAFSETADLRLVIGTSEVSRKAVNIGRDPRVAYTVTDADKRYTFQLEGTARKLTDEEMDEFADRHFAKLPFSAPFRNVEGQCYFLITPTWSRFSDCNPYPWVTTIFE